MRFSPTDERGVTLLEILIFSSVGVGLLLWMGQWFAKPTRIQQKMQATFEERQALRATDSLVNDLKQVTPGSVVLENARPDSPLAFHVTGFPSALGEFPSAGIPVRYVFEPNVLGSEGILYRTEGGTTTVVLKNLILPDETVPLFQQDLKWRILTIQMRMKVTKGTAIRVVRRVALPN